MKTGLEKSLKAYRRRSIIRKRIISVLAVLAVCTFFFVDNMMMITAVGKDRNPRLSADQMMMLTGGELRAHVSAEADADKDETVFVIKSEGAGAGLAETYQFINGAADITDSEGVVRKLYAEETEDEGTVIYTFTLSKGENTEFDLYFAETGKEEPETEEEPAENEETAPEQPVKEAEETSQPGNGEGSNGEGSNGEESNGERSIEPEVSEDEEAPEKQLPEEESKGEIPGTEAPDPDEIPDGHNIPGMEGNAGHGVTPAAENKPEAEERTDAEENIETAGNAETAENAGTAENAEAAEDAKKAENAEAAKDAETAENAKILRNAVTTGDPGATENPGTALKAGILPENLPLSIQDDASDLITSEKPKTAEGTVKSDSSGSTAGGKLLAEEKAPAVTAEVVLTAGSGKDTDKALERADKDEEPLILQWVSHGLPDQTQFLTAALYTDGKYKTRLLEKGTIISVFGEMPPGIVARAYPIETDPIGSDKKNEETQTICAYDISLYTLDGMEWQPEKGSLEVSIRTSSMQEASAEEGVKAVKVYHINKNGEPEKVRLTDGLEGLQADRGVAFEAKIFSPYAVVLIKEAEPANEVYLSGQGDDKNTGLKWDDPVKTFAKAKEILGDTEGTIYICRTVQVTEDESWELSKGQSVVRLPVNDERNYIGTMVHVKDGAALTLSGITLDGGSEDSTRGTKETKAKGPIILIDEGSSAVLSEGSVLQNNDNTNTTADELPYSCHGGGAAVYGGTLTINGGEIINCSAAFGGGIFIGRGGSAAMNSGSIIGNDAAIIDGAPIMEALPAITHDSGAGGGVALAISTSIEEEMLAQGESAVFVMNGGTISGNTAYTGGGISAGSYNFYESSFYAAHMLIVNGGSIVENTAENAGGGVFVGAGASGEFTGHSRTDICGNTVTEGDQNAGGGIYIDGECGIRGYVKMDNVVITDNTSSSFGGGISACPSGDTNVLLERGGAIFGNTAAANAKSDDVFIDRAGVSYLVDTMLGGGSHNWEFTYSQDLLGKAYPSGEDTAAAEHIAHIFITGNSASSSDPLRGRGGGIGNNGLLEIGEKEPHSFAIRKVDEISEADLSGAIFTLEGTTVSGNPFKAEQITDGGGYALFESLPFGIYTLTETKAPDGYVTSDRVLTLDLHAGTGVTLTENGEILPLENGEYGWDYVFTNRKDEEEPPETGLTIELYKINDYQKPLGGAVFELYKADGDDRTLTGEAVTGNDGLASWEKLEAGSYILRETRAPEGYLPIEEDIELTLEEDGTLTFANGQEISRVKLDNDRTGRITVTDDENEYTLPATGGTGTTIFVMAGSLLMAAALALIYRYKRKTR